MLKQVINYMIFFVIVIVLVIMQNFTAAWGSPAQFIIGNSGIKVALIMVEDRKPS